MQMAKVVIAEDNELLRNLYIYFLNKLGMKLAGAFSSGEETVDFIKHNADVDFVFMDIELSMEMNGVEAVEEIRQFSDCPVLFISNMPYAKVSNQIEALDHVAFTPKIFRAEILKEILEREFSPVIKQREPQLA